MTSLNRLSLYLIILLEGFITISLEILTIRQLIPIVGSSLIITSLIIGFFLLFLAHGYRKGGTYKSGYIAILQRNFTLAAFALGIGLSYLFIEEFFFMSQKWFLATDLISLILYLSLIISPIVYLLGQTVPITLNLWKKESSLSEVGSKVLHLSTIGSFLGSTITALLMLNFLGVAWTIVINVLILILLVFLLSDFKSQKTDLFLMLVLVVFVYLLNVHFENKIFVKTNNYANYQIVNGKDFKVPKDGTFLIINDSFSSFLDKEKHGFEYIEFIKKIIFKELKLTNKTILVLGAGGFTLSAENSFGNHFVYVDIDHQIASVVKDRFLNKINGNFIADDAIHFLHTHSQKYSVVISDVYTNRHAIPAHLVTREYFHAIRESLTEDGIAIYNFIANPTLTDNYSKHLDTTLRSVFDNCMSIPMHYSDLPTNIIYVCKKSKMESDKTVYTNNLNKVSLDSIRSTI